MGATAKAIQGRGEIVARTPVEVTGSRGDEWLRLPIALDVATADDGARKVVGRLLKETDAGCALIAASHLSVVLRRLIETALVHASRTGNQRLFQADGPLGTFSARIRMAGAMGLLAEDELADLDQVRKIRNAFAHEIEEDGADPAVPLSFDAERIAGRVRDLRLPRILYRHPTLTVSRDTPRDRFEIGVGILALLMQSVRRMNVQAPERPAAWSELLLEQYQQFRSNG